MIAYAGSPSGLDPGAAVDRLDLEVRPGELFAFLGPNGAGKTDDDQDDLRAARIRASGTVRVGGFERLPSRLDSFWVMFPISLIFTTS